MRKRYNERQYLRLVRKGFSQNPPESETDPESAPETKPPTTSPDDKGGRQPAKQERESDLPPNLPADDDDDAWSKLPKWVRDLRREAADRRVKLRDAEKERDEAKTKLQEISDAELTENERLKKRLEALENSDLPSAKKQVREARAELQAEKLGIVDTEAAIKLLDWDSIKDEEAATIRTALEALLEQKPWLKKPESEATPPSNTSPTNPQRKPEVTVFSRKDIEKMSPEEINKHFEDGTLKTALKEGRITES
jgi:hypothetical protein